MESIIGNVFAHGAQAFTDDTWLIKDRAFIIGFNLIDSNQTTHRPQAQI